MSVGKRNRAVASTKMNAVSSRSHAIFTITVECSSKPIIATGAVEGAAAAEVNTDDERLLRMGKLNLVDLAVRFDFNSIRLRAMTIGLRFADRLHPFVYRAVSG